MSMEIYVLSDKQLDSIAVWQSAIDAERFLLVLDTKRPIAQLQGYLSAPWKGKQAGFECDHWEAKDVLNGYPNIGFDHRWNFCLAFRWGADVVACLGAYMAAAAYAEATNGVVFDCEAGKILTPQQAGQTARTIEQQLPMFEQTLKDTQTAAIRKLGP